MISQPLSRVFSFHNMAKAGKENQCGFSVLPAAARLENLGAKLGGRQLHISHNAPCLRKHCFHFLQKKLKTKFMWLFFFAGVAGRGVGEEGSKQGVLWEMCKWQILFISTKERQVEIIDSVTHFRSKGFVWEFIMKENIPQSHIYPKASFVLRSFRPILWSHSAYFCPLSRRCRISCFPIYKLVGFYVNSSKKPNTSMSFIVAFSNIFHDKFVVFIFSMESCGYTF